MLDKLAVMGCLVFSELPAHNKVVTLFWTYCMVQYILYNVWYIFIYYHTHVITTTTITATTTTILYISLLLPLLLYIHKYTYNNNKYYKHTYLLPLTYANTLLLPYICTLPCYYYYTLTTIATTIHQHTTPTPILLHLYSLYHAPATLYTAAPLGVQPPLQRLTWIDYFPGMWWYSVQSV